MAIGRINATLSGVQPGGLAKIVPTSVAVGSGSGSVDANGAVTFSGASSIGINGCFSSVYTNYKVLISFNTPSADANIYVKFRIGTTDTSTAYYWGYYGIRSANITFSGTVNNDTAGFYIGDFDSASSRSYYATNIDIFNPNIANATSLTSQTSGIHTSGGSLFFNTGCWQDSTSQFDGFNVILSAGNVAGTIRVYGYTN